MNRRQFEKIRSENPFMPLNDIVHELVLQEIISFSLMPPEPMSTPIVIKNGTAIRLNEEMPFTICWHSVLKLRPCTPRQSTVDSATA